MPRGQNKRRVSSDWKAPFFLLLIFFIR